jgi:beta-lactamase class D
MRTPVLFISFLFFYQIAVAQINTEMNFKSQFEKYGIDGCFVLYKPVENEYIRYNSELCDSGYIPASTFKIPHSLIALEEGIVKDTIEIIKWDGHEWPAKSWNHDQTLKTAVKYSCVWVYTGFAEKIGIDKYKTYVGAFDYGNKDLTGRPFRFWLEGSFRISANQQIEFLNKFYNYKLPVSRQSIDIVKDLIVLEQKDSYTLSGKTGGGILGENKYIMWLVGYVVKNNKPYYYAMNFESNDFGKHSQIRYEVTKDILRQLDLIE